MTVVPTKSEEFSKLIEYLRKAQEASAMLAHLNNDSTKGRGIAMGWLHVENQLKMTVAAVTALAMKGLQ